MNTSQKIEIILYLCVLAPIHYYLYYWILSQLNPDRLIWFLFIIYVPVVIIANIISKVSEK